MKTEFLAALFFTTMIVACGSGSNRNALTNDPAGNAMDSIPPQKMNQNENDMDKIQKTDEEWKKELTSEQYQVLRKHGTERAFSGALLNNQRRCIFRFHGC